MSWKVNYGNGVNSLSKFLHIMSGNRRSLIVLFLLILLTSILEAFGIGLIGPFITIASFPEKINQIPALKAIFETGIFSTKSQYISFIGLVLILVFFVKSYTNFKIRRHIFYFSLSFQGGLRSTLLQTYLRMPYLLHLETNTAVIIQNVVNETSQFANGVLLEILNSSVSIILILSLTFILVITSPIASLIICILMLISFLILYKYKTTVRELGRSGSKAQTNIIKIINHSLGGIKETKIFGCENYFKDELNIYVKSYAETTSKLITINMIPRFTLEVIMISFIVGLASIYILLEYDPSELITTLSVFSVVSIKLLPAVTQLINGINRIRSSSHSIDAIYHALRKIDLTKNDDLFEEKPKIIFNDKIILNHVYFEYPNSSYPALDNVSITIKKGQSVAVIGKSGAGKTTLIDIILGLLKPQKGDVEVDDVSIFNNIDSWQKLIAYIPQSIFLLDDTIERNIAFGVRDDLIDLDKLNMAIEASQLSELIKELPLGVKTQIGERGARLSGGQRQRIGIARALYHEREVFIFDEATSALDKDTENLVSQSIRSLCGHKTVIFIAHRLSTIQHCDCFYTIEKGKIIKSEAGAERSLKQIN